jgi:hypothetical protein
MNQSNWVPDEVPLDRPNVARMYDYFLGGGHNFAIDREAAEQLFTVYPDLPLISQVNRAVLRRVVRFLIGEGISQFLDIGSGIPTSGNVHEVAQRANPDARVVYVDVEPIAVAHSQAILHGVPNATAIQADARQTEEVINHPAVQAQLDWNQPMGILLFALLHFVPDDGDAAHIVRSLCQAMHSGSYLVITHATAEQVDESGVHVVEQLYQRATSPFHFRTREQVAELFEGLELVEPGLVHSPLWRPESEDDLFVDQPARSSAYVAVGRKP